MTRRLLRAIQLPILLLAVAGSGMAYTAPTPRSASQPVAPVPPPMPSPVGEAGTRSGAPVAFPSPADLVAGTRRVNDPAAAGAPSVSVGPLPHAPSPTARRTERPSRTDALSVGHQSPAPSPDSRQIARTLTGTATWYATGGPGSYAAMREYRDGTRVIVTVTAVHDGRTWSITVPIATQCGACRFRSGAILLDLSGAAWDALGWPRSRGVIPVTVAVVEGSL